MESSTDTATTTVANSFRHFSSSPPPPPPTTTKTKTKTKTKTTTVLSPCAACKILRRRCVENCILAPYFPPTEPLKFTAAHRVFGTSNIIKLLQELPASQRADAASSMVYEANARIRDPVYGCAGAICQLQKEVNELQAQLARAQAEIVDMQARHANLMAVICIGVTQTQQNCFDGDVGSLNIIPYSFQSDALLSDESNEGSFWEEPLWA